MIPPQASTVAPRVDALFFSLVALTALLGIGITLAIVYFAVKYRRRGADEVGQPARGGLLLELTWTVIPLAIVLGLFGWSSWIFVTLADVPGDALDVYVVGKQWMWKVQHPDGQREINQVTVPVNRDIRLILTSQDVIHDFYVPAFRVKTDVVPGRYTKLWFNVTRPGHYQVFCAEYCGTQHSGMRAEVVALRWRDYEAWLARGAGGATLASQGRKLFQDLACESCHRLDAQGRGPVLEGLFGATVQLQSGERVAVDEAYVRRAILRPQAQVAAGFQPIMPSFQGLVSEEQLVALVEYVKSLGAGAAVQQPPAPPARQIEGFGTRPAGRREERP